MNKKEKVGAVGVPKQKEEGMNRMWKGKGVPMKIGMVAGALIVSMLMGAGAARAGFEVQNRADIVYFTSVQQLISYTAFDTAWVVVLYGPKMFIAKGVANEVTGESSPDMVHVSRGESITFHLYSQNDDPADTDAWHVTITDSFAMLSMILLSNASVGPSMVNDSFTYCTGTEVATAGNSYAVPDSIQYYVVGTGWTNSQTYSAKNEATGTGGASRIAGIKWYWRRISSKTVWSDAAGNNIVASPGNYKIHVQFSLKRNDN